MKVKAHAKINLALDIIRKRDDGYHDLEMIMIPITLHDLLYVDIIDEGIVIESNSKVMPTDGKNIMHKVAKIIMEEYKIKKGIKIFVYKHIPTQAGLAGGSADGAAVIKAMNSLFQLQMTNEKMAEIGKQVGADLPFCIYEKKAFVEGIGEKLQFINQSFDAQILLVKPKKGVSTKKAFTNIKLEKVKHANCHKMKKGMEEQNYQSVIDNLQNTLEIPSIELVPEIQIIKDTMLSLGFDGALMSGSGSCVFGITRDLKVLEKGYQHFKNKNLFVRKTEVLNS
ncbi:MAG: 4-(cytidine 5'-diphospho)-2-C-methyl-D-erythritol kinase [Coprobacillaceae bacterium]